MHFRNCLQSTMMRGDVCVWAGCILMQCITACARPREAGRGLTADAQVCVHRNSPATTLCGCVYCLSGSVQSDIRVRPACNSLI